MKLDIRYSHHPEDVKGYDTAALRRHFLVEKIFVPGELNLVYTHVDRVVFGGAVPTGQDLALEGGKEFGTPNFLDRRELGVVNLGGAGRVRVEGEAYALGNGDGLYVGMGAKSVSFESEDVANPAKFYIMSCPAHATYPTVRITRADANPRKLGAAESCNVRTIYQYVHPAVCKSCQLVMGVTVLEPGSVWNTFPPHTHERRMEVYLYFGMSEATRVFHLHGQPAETRHIVVANEQAVISPSWSIHSGVASGPYSFVWGMAGENQTFDDMDNLGPNDLK
ncbi:5-dehydro-4-deoxy-D-glucuronate isomerase [Propionivibrio soli]|uniref:5-dehydro-4-deoxy-D-glucuronate isomerase n=1 Tax=Propionivibrio soli TaxID=2976531 RepID=UPI0021E78C4E|nr:5-dehydro-4-deoxy-D-glucuronate isomerase [Propionivibrio soli]